VKVCIFFLLFEYTKVPGGAGGYRPADERIPEGGYSMLHPWIKGE
jgi:hypothetical protein